MHHLWLKHHPQVDWPFKFRLVCSPVPCTALCGSQRGTTLSRNCCPIKKHHVKACWFWIKGISIKQKSRLKEWSLCLWYFLNQVSSLLTDFKSCLNRELHLRENKQTSTLTSPGAKLDFHFQNVTKIVKVFKYIFLLAVCNIYFCNNNGKISRCFSFPSTTPCFPTNLLIILLRV